MQDRKLARDTIVEIVKQRGESPDFCVADEEYVQQLHEKIYSQK